LYIYPVFHVPFFFLYHSVSLFQIFMTYALADRWSDNRPFLQSPPLTRDSLSLYNGGRRDRPHLRKQLRQHPVQTQLLTHFPNNIRLPTRCLLILLLSEERFHLQHQSNYHCFSFRSIQSKTGCAFTHLCFTLSLRL
jgi:hypothetical protein